MQSLVTIGMAERLLSVPMLKTNGLWRTRRPILKLPKPSLSVADCPNGRPMLKKATNGARAGQTEMAEGLKNSQELKCT